MSDERGFVFHGPDGQVELSIDEVRGLADRNDPDGLYALAMAYLFGWDVEQNEDVGYDLLEKAVAAGQTEAMALMVRLFMQGDYCGIDSEKAAGYAIEAARDGIPDAQLYAGLAYMDGVSVPQDYAEAAGLVLGAPVSVSESGSYHYANRVQPTMLMASASAKDEASSASYYAGDLSVAADVDVTFTMH